MKYIVKRAHQGDKWYAEGEVREAEPRDVAHLVANGVLAEEQEQKAAPKVANKAAPKAERNKSA